MAAGALWAGAAAPAAVTTVLLRAKGRALREGGYCPVLYRRDRFRLVREEAFWISYTPDTPDSVLPGTWLPRIVNTARLEIIGKEEAADEERFLDLFNAHLDWWALSCRRGGRVVAQQMNLRYDGVPQILVGDFNGPCGGATYCSLQEQAAMGSFPPLTDAYEEAPVREGPEETYHGGDGKGGWPGRIDHVFSRPEHVRALRVATLDDHEGEIYPSDHFPVLADLRIEAR